MALATAGMVLLSTMDTGTSRLTSGAYMLVLGIGIGLTMQVLVLATQNAVPAKDVGAATSTVLSARLVGASVGVSILGAIFAGRLGDELPRHLPAAVFLDVGSITPQAVRRLPPAAQQGLAEAFAHSLSPVFLAAVPVLAVAFLLTLLLRDRPLRDYAGLTARPAASSDAREPSALENTTRSTTRSTTRGGTDHEKPEAR
jgi:hypothetical protein